mmetsp:Transcript_15202/g.52816  ORF Transcript_15202/g.52816 Transcript_15202/m.52816 type:complete len:415 (+) Transcript_15202:1427-2671(+)
MTLGCAHTTGALLPMRSNRRRRNAATSRCAATKPSSGLAVRSMDRMGSLQQRAAKSTTSAACQPPSPVSACSSTPLRYCVHSAPSSEKHTSRHSAACRSRNGMKSSSSTSSSPSPGYTHARSTRSSTERNSGFCRCSARALTSTRPRRGQKSSGSMRMSMLSCCVHSSRMSITPVARSSPAASASNAASPMATAMRHRPRHSSAFDDATAASNRGRCASKPSTTAATPADASSTSTPLGASSPLLPSSLPRGAAPGASTAAASPSSVSTTSTAALKTSALSAPRHASTPASTDGRWRCRLPSVTPAGTHASRHLQQATTSASVAPASTPSASPSSDTMCSPSAATVCDLCTCGRFSVSCASASTRSKHSRTDAADALSLARPSDCATNVASVSPPDMAAADAMASTMRLSTASV